MEAYQLIHPAVAAFAILLFAATAWTKLGPKNRRVFYEQVPSLDIDALSRR